MNLIRILMVECTFNLTAKKKFKNDPKASYELLESKLGKERTTIIRSIKKMKDTGILRRSGSNKNGFWEIL